MLGIVEVDEAVQMVALLGLAFEARAPADARARAADQEDADSSSAMFSVTTSIVRPSSSVGLNSTTSVPA